MCLLDKRFLEHMGKGMKGNWINKTYQDLNIYILMPWKLNTYLLNTLTNMLYSKRTQILASSDADWDIIQKKNFYN